MKNLILAALLVGSPAVFAKGGDHLNCTRCMAVGQLDGKKVYGWGVAKKYDSEARASAVKVCEAKHATQCYAKYCYARQRCPFN